MGTPPTDTFQKRIDDLFDQCRHKNGDLDADLLKVGMRAILENNKSLIDKLLVQLRALIGEESTLTIPVSDGCVAKVHFTAPVTKENLSAFCKIFQSIADNFFMPQSANAGEAQATLDTSGEPNIKAKNS